MIVPRILKDPYTLFPFIISIIFIVVGFSVVYTNLSYVQNLLVIHYDTFNGIDFLGNKSDVLNLLFSGLVMIGLNIFLGRELYLREKFLSYLLAFSTPVFTLLILIGVFAIISIN
ncbi:MAG: Uncharacterized protein Athens071426_121 [Parcubacteria group bacterium Athens0714_26]|nr:MAG: Uncharacterized protein Athens101426_658 [Parcubacteria group bacterium Athens1014_26]TSD03673.1 MAG: Uncharacterized protein Athens071426_121 [Parcubacteria group bacterium Athens0714_26]